MGWVHQMAGLSGVNSSKCRGQAKDEDLRKGTNRKEGSPRGPGSLGVGIHLGLRLEGRIHLWGWDLRAGG